MDDCQYQLTNVCGRYSLLGKEGLGPVVVVVGCALERLS